MKKLAVCIVSVVAGAVWASDYAVAQLKPSQDHFESRRRDAEYRAKLSRQRTRANRRVVPTFTVPQPAYHRPYGHRYYEPRFDPRYDRRHRDGGYVYIPGHYQNVHGQLVYVPPHYEYIRR